MTYWLRNYQDATREDDNLTKRPLHASVVFANEPRLSDKASAWGMYVLRISISACHRTTTQQTFNLNLVWPHEPHCCECLSVDCSLTCRAGDYRIPGVVATCHIPRSESYFHPPALHYEACMLVKMWNVIIASTAELHYVPHRPIHIAELQQSPCYKTRATITLPSHI